MPLYVPDSVALDQQEQRARLYHEQIEKYREVFDRYNKLLREIDPNLQLVRAQEDAYAPGLKPGYWHVFRHVAGSPPTVHVHQGPNGEYREPDSGLFEDLKRGDMWNERSRREQEKRQKAAERAADREAEREAAERVDEITERLRSLKGSQILVPKGVG